jgi:Fe-S oxidoreductase/nitrate reductase gamma subunit
MTPSRTSYWLIQHVWVFYLLAALAVGVFLFGLIIHVSVWIKGIKRQKIPFSWRGISNLFLDGVFGRRIFKGDIAAGTMHILILWGFLGLFVGTVLISVDYWLFHFLSGSVYIWYSTCLEVMGLMLMIGIVWALIRRYLQRVPRLESRIEDLTVVILLFVVVLSGFVVEGIRLAVQRPEWTKWSFGGHWVSLLFTQPQSAQSIYPYLWWVHALLSLGFIAYIPFCKLFHILAAPASIYLENQPLQAIPVETRSSDDEVFSYRDMIFFDACTRCGRCVEVCPSTGAGEPFSPRDFIVWARNNLLMKYHPLNHVTWFKDWISHRDTKKQIFEPEKIWHCTTCMACLDVCPVYVATLDSIRQARSKLVEEGTQVPPLLTQSLKNLYKYNNPWEATKKKRAQWSGDLEIPNISQSEEIEGLCYFVGCTTSMDIRAQELARSFALILKHAQTPFSTLGKKEPCCGDIARRVGEDGLFEKQMEDCVELFQRCEIHDIVTSSPHCFHTFRNEYPTFQALKPPDEQVEFRVRHYTQILRELVASGSLKFERPLNVTVTYHDPCYLGRHNQIFDAPREVIGTIPGVQIVEMAHSRANSLCCGGGGDRIWQEDLDADVKMSEIRIREAEATGAEILITACPLCLIMLEDARKTTGLEDSLQVMDLNELVAIALGLHKSSGLE